MTDNCKYSIERYNPLMAGEWDDFVKSSRNATFLFQRAYMDYHADRFADCSWVVRKRGRIVSLLPANLSCDGVLHSHAGLTYGGWLLPAAHINGADLLEIFSEMCSVWRCAGIKALDYKPVPYIYHVVPSQEDIYALFRLGAKLSECSLSAAVDLRNSSGFNKQMSRHLAKALQVPDVSVSEESNPAEFMKMLEECLATRHGVTPVHSPREMERLMNAFPNNIRIFTLRVAGELMCGVCVYDTGITAHLQYIAATPRGRELNLMSLLVDRLISEIFNTRKYLDFGISCENGGEILNEGLLRQKFSYGATGVVYTRYWLDL
ncbi:MAG: GNAT family N-acetyltransferase [Candidatus Amulumruptor caecigallinarius]|nr:GNAT family N-acetyltransferase [Candidatus Amulumruptor caecigallinarius]